jgi:hypothetical protein
MTPNGATEICSHYKTPCHGSVHFWAALRHSLKCFIKVTTVIAIPHISVTATQTKATDNIAALKII